MIAPLLALTLLQAPPPAESPDQVVTSFAHYLNRGEIQQAASRVEGGRFTYPAMRLEAIFKGTKRTITLLNLVSVERPKIDGSTATVSIRAVVLGKEEPAIEEVRFRWSEDRWKIVPTIPNPHNAQEGPPVSVWGLACAHPTAMLAVLIPIMHQASGEVMKTPSGKEMGMFSMFTMMYAATYGDVLPKDADALRTGLKPVLALAAPDGAKKLDELVKTRDGVTLRLNPNLLGLSQHKVKDPRWTVLAYEEDEGGISFRHNGKALLAFADGMVRLLSKEEESRVYWLPE